VSLKKRGRFGWFLWSSWLVACSASNPAPSNSRGGGATPIQPTTAGSGGASTIGPGADNPGSPIANSGASGSAGAPVIAPPVVDANAAPYLQDDSGMSGIAPATLTKLKAGGGACAVKVTFPYDYTVFPGGLTAPLIMWDSAADAAYVHLAYTGNDKVDYQFAVALNNDNELQIPRPAWDEITRRTNNALLNVTLNVSVGGNVSSCQLHWKVAPGNLVGALYYNTYQAPAPGVQDEGAVMRQTFGSTAEIYKQYTMPENVIPGTGPCYSCHSVSFNGSTLVASFHDYSAQTFRVEKYDVTSSNMPAASGMLDNANFGALTPDGKRILAMGNPECTAGADSFPRATNNFPLVEGPAIARVLDTQSGMDTQAQGLNKDFYMWMPQFSPDGTKVVFNHAKPDGMMGTDRRELAIMDYDAASNTFSNLKVILSASKMPGIVAPSLDYSPAPANAGVLSCGAGMCGPDGMATCVDGSTGLPIIGAIPGIPGDVAALPKGSCTGPCYPAWPFFTPDNKGVVFSMVSEPDFTQAFPGRDTPSLSELWYADLDLNQAIRLDQANKGLKDIDATNNYYPTVMPVAVGGYFWMFWTAVRDYGDKVAGRDAADAAAGAAGEAIKKRIWGAALKPKPKTVELQDDTLVDPSSPGFYLDGQSESGNVRAFAALSPCLQNGATCKSGLDCCCGYCSEDQGASSGVCTCEIPMCAKLNEKCTKDSDCCPPAKPSDPDLSCLGGFCGFIMLN
jgi:hypothetical protein